MNYIKLCVIGFFISTVFSGCAQDKIDNHLIKLRKKNTQIHLNGWTIEKQVLTSEEEYFSLGKVEKDTFYKCVFTYFPIVNKYNVDLFAKSYVENGIYHEISLHNNDTLYYFTSKKSSNSLKNGDFIKMEDRNFKLGWYYYLYKHGELNMKQKQFFEQNKDSLIQLRGNNLPYLLRTQGYSEK